jgi:hypothetical protein
MSRYDKFKREFALGGRYHHLCPANIKLVGSVIKSYWDQLSKERKHELDHDIFPNLDDNVQHS